MLVTRIISYRWPVDSHIPQKADKVFINIHIYIVVALIRKSDKKTKKNSALSRNTETILKNKVLLSKQPVLTWFVEKARHIRGKKYFADLEPKYIDGSRAVVV